MVLIEANKNKTTSDNVGARLLINLDRQIKNNDLDRLQSFLNTIQNFLIDGGRISINAVPKQAVPVSKLIRLVSENNFLEQKVKQKSFNNMHSIYGVHNISDKIIENKIQLKDLISITRGLPRSLCTIPTKT